MGPAPPAVWPSEVRQGAVFGPSGDLYEVGAELGSGAAARVFACRRLRTGEELAVKVVNLQRLQLCGDVEGHLTRLEREVQILQDLHHPRIVNLRDFHRTEACYFLIMERVVGGELFNQIVHKKSLSEAEAKYIFRQLLEGIHYMHSKHVIHRDLKPENILIMSSRLAPHDCTDEAAEECYFHEVKIADFGLSKVISEGTSLAKTCVGTPQYWAPEVLNVQHGGGSYDEAADFWGLGAVLFVMLCGRYPFDGKKMPMDEQIRTATFSMTGVRWKKVSESAKSLIRGLLRVVPSERLTLEECLTHPWLADAEAALESTFSEQRLLRPPSEQPLAEAQAEAEDTEEAAGHRRPPRSMSPRGLRRERLERDLSPATRASDSGLSRKSTSCYSVPAAAPKTPPPRRRSFWRSWYVVPALLGLLALRLAPWGRLEAWLLRRRSSVFADEVATLPSGAADGPRREQPVWVDGNRRHDASATHPGHFGEQGGGGECTSSTSALKDSVFRLRELLKLQVSIMGSLEMARLALRHADPDLAAATQQTFHEARDVFQKAANLILHYAQVARQVSESILPDLQLAVEEQEPSLAVGLLGVVKGWVADMKLEGDSVRVRYTDLQGSVFRLARRVQETKLSADGRLAEMLHRTKGAVSVTPTEGAVKVTPLSSSSAVAAPLSSSMNSLTRQLFEQLGKESSMPTDAAAHREVQVVEVASEDDWKQEVLDLLFMAPGTIRSAAVAAGGGAASWPEGPVECPEPEDQGEVADDSAEPQDDDGTCGEADSSTGTAQPVVRFIRPTVDEAQAAREFATNSSTVLLRALRELRRVDVILQGCSSFWANMDSTVQQLARMKDATERLVGYASSSQRLRERFEQRLGEYGAFWSALENLCRQYGLDHSAATSKFHDFVLEVSHTADLIDTHRASHGTFVPRATEAADGRPPPAAEAAATSAEASE